MISASDEKRRTFNSFFSVQGTGGIPTGPDSEIRVGDQDIGSPGRPVSSGLQVPGEPGHCHTMGMRHIVIRGLSGCTVFFTLSHKRQNIRQKVG